MPRTSSRRSTSQRATAKQQRYLKDLLRERGLSPNELGYVKTLTKREASDFISRLTGKRTSGERAGTCAACGRPLTDAESLARGLGPECAKRYA